MILTRTRKQIGDKVRHSRGYILIYMPSHPRAHNGYVLEHIVVAEKKIGRPLKSDEDAHHENLIHWDNRPKNVTVLTKKEHHALHGLYQRMISDICNPKPPKKPKKIIPWPEDDKLLSWSKFMTTRDIAKKIGNVSNVAVWIRVKKIQSRVVQLVERSAVNGEVAGAHPAPGEYVVHQARRPAGADATGRRQFKKEA